MIILRGRRQSRVSVAGIGGIHVGASLQEHSYDRKIAMMRGQLKRSEIVLVPDFWVGTSIKQQTHHLHLTEACG